MGIYMHKVNHRKQMNDHLAVLRSLLPCFYVKRSDEASIIGMVVDYITELQQSLEAAKKQRKVVYMSPRPPPLPISPTTPQSLTPYTPTFSNSYLQPSSSSTSSSNSDDIVKSSIADVEVKFSGSNLLILKTISPRLPACQAKQPK